MCAHRSRDAASSPVGRTPAVLEMAHWLFDPGLPLTVCSLGPPLPRFGAQCLHRSPEALLPAPWGCGFIPEVLTHVT